jgi:hypothetical protein
MEQRRHFVRVDTSILMSTKEILEIPKMWGHTATLYLTSNEVNFSFNNDSIETEDMFKLLYGALGTINDSLNEIKEALNLDVDFMKKQQVNISGSGISFFKDKPFKEGTNLIVSMVLPLELPILVKAVGKVVNSPKKDEKTGKYFTKVTFDLIHTDDRELIVRYTFKRQREIINLNKEN